MKKFLVVSYDPDQQQWFRDFELAIDAEAAIESVLSDREYCISGTAFESGDLRTYADELDDNWKLETDT